MSWIVALFGQTEAIGVAPVITAVIAVLTVVFGSIGTALKFFLNYLEKSAEKQEKHETALLERFEKMAAKFDATVREFREEHQNTIKMLLQIQTETIGAVNSLSNEVRALGEVIHKMEVPK